MNVRFLTVEVSGVGGAGSEAQLYLIPSAGYRTMELSDGRLSARFGRAQGYRGVSAVRLDLATEPGAVLTVEGAVVNDRLAVILDFQKLYLSAWALGLLAVLEVLGWRRLFMLRQEERRGSSGRSGPAALDFREDGPHPGRCGATGNFKGRDLWSSENPSWTMTERDVNIFCAGCLFWAWRSLPLCPCIWEQEEEEKHLVRTGTCGPLFLCMVFWRPSF